MIRTFTVGENTVYYSREHDDWLLVSNSGNVLARNSNWGNPDYESEEHNKVFAEIEARIAKDDGEVISYDAATSQAGSEFERCIDEWQFAPGTMRTLDITPNANLLNILRQGK